MRVFACLFLIAFLVSGCLRDCRQDYLSDALKPFLFKEGSFWVYADSSANALDTFRLIQSQSGILNSNANQPVACRGNALTEYFNMTIVSSSDTFSCSTEVSSILYFKKSDLGIQSYILDVRLAIGECRQSFTNPCLVNRGDVMVGSNSFNDVREIRTTLDNRLGSSIDNLNLYWAKNIGLVKIVTSNTTMNLVEWHVVQ